MYDPKTEKAPVKNVWRPIALIVVILFLFALNVRYPNWAEFFSHKKG